LATLGVWKFAPLVAMGGVALAVGAWMVPIPGLGVTPGEPGAGGGVTPPAQIGRKDTPDIQRHDWLALVGPLNEVRTPVPISTPPIGEKPPPPPPPPGGQLEGWRFAGTVTEPDGVVAIVSVDGDQRYYREGQIVTLKDGVTTAEIMSVESDHVVVRVEAEDQTVTKDGPQQPNRLPARRTQNPNAARRGHSGAAGGGT